MLTRRMLKSIVLYIYYLHYSDLKTLKSDFILLYNTLPISYTSTPERILLFIVIIIIRNWIRYRKYYIFSK